MKIKEKEKNISQKAPKSEGNAGVDFDSIKLLTRTDEIEKRINLLEKSLEFLKSTNWFILIVLFVGFLALLFSLISMGIQTFNTNSSNQIELSKSIDRLNNSIEKSK